MVLRRTSRIIGAFQSFAHTEALGGVILLACASVALLWANSGSSELYFDLWRTPLRVSLGGAGLAKPLSLWINDGLMAIFFLVVGLEIKRELLVGELATPRKAALPLAAALGGMLVPALVYFALNRAGEGVRGWGIPMATDIAFALGVLALVGSRAPVGLKVFLTALAIVDDLGAVLVIALFYTEKLSPAALVAGAVFLAVLLVLNRLRIRTPIPYGLVGLMLWVALLKSGLHATIAGVLLALTIPARQKIDAREFARRGRELLAAFEADMGGPDAEPSPSQRDAVLALDSACEEVETPLRRLEHALHPWVAFLIMPIFALANSGVALAGAGPAALAEPVALGVILGLVAGKQAGVFLFAWAAVRLGLADRPAGVGWLELYGASLLCGIGFTMSLFIASLAFGDTPVLVSAKLGILAGSAAAGIAGWTVLRLSGSRAEGV